MQDYVFGFTSNDYAANQAIIALAPSLSDQECRDVLKEALAAEASDLSYEELKEFDDYWINATSGWRDRLQESAVWLTGERNRDYFYWAPAEFHAKRRRPLGSLRTVQYVLALELYRREHGRFPESLAAVQAAYDLPDSVDPFTQFAPVYRRTETGFLLYSVGLDGKDNGGEFPPPDNKAIPLDSANQDINLVPDRQMLADQWADYLKAMPVPPPAPAPTVSDGAPEGDAP